MNDFSSPDGNPGMEGRRRSSRAVSGEITDPHSNIIAAIDRLDSAMESLQEEVERNRMKVDPVTDNTRRMEDSAEKTPSGERMGSAIQQALHERADRIVRITNQIRDVNERIDL